MSQHRREIWKGRFTGLLQQLAGRTYGFMWFLSSTSPVTQSQQGESLLLRKCGWFRAFSSLFWASGQPLLLRIASIGQQMKATPQNTIVYTEETDYKVMINHWLWQMPDFRTNTHGRPQRRLETCWNRKQLMGARQEERARILGNMLPRRIPQLPKECDEKAPGPLDLAKFGVFLCLRWEKLTHVLAERRVWLGNTPWTIWTWRSLPEFNLNPNPNHSKSVCSPKGQKRVQPIKIQKPSEFGSIFVWKRAVTKKLQKWTLLSPAVARS